MEWKEHASDIRYYSREFFSTIKKTNQEGNSSHSFGGLFLLSNDYFGCGFEYENLYAKKEFSSNEIIMKYQIPAEIFSLTGVIYLPFIESITPFIGVSIGILSSDSEFSYVDAESRNQTSNRVSNKGQSVTKKIFVGCSINIDENCFCNFTLGHRDADLDVRIMDTDINRSYDGTLTWSGAIIRLGLGFRFKISDS